MEILSQWERWTPFLGVVATALLGYWRLRGTANHVYVQGLEARIDRVERELKKCEEARERLLDENLHLTRRIIEAGLRDHP
jgi:hypothetical protein